MGGYARLYLYEKAFMVIEFVYASRCFSHNSSGQYAQYVDTLLRVAYFGHFVH